MVKLSYTKNGERIVVETDYVAIVSIGRDPRLPQHDRIVLNGVVAHANECNLTAHRCKIEVDGCSIEPLRVNGARPVPSTAVLS